MKKSIRLALMAGACFLGLAFAAPAFSAYSPSLIMEQSSYKLGAPITADVFLAIPKNDDATAKVTIFSPVGFNANLTQAPGTQIGVVAAHVKAKMAGDAVFTLRGNVVAADPTNSTLQAAAAKCTGSSLHNAIWVLNASLQGQTIQIPDYVDKVGPLVTQQVCLPSPDVPFEMGGAVLGAQLFAADFTIKNVFTNAGTNGDYEWSGIFTPYVPGPAGTVNTAGTVEARTLVGLPTSLTLKRVLAKHGFKLVGQLKVAGVNPVGVKLDLYSGKKAAPAPNAVFGGTGKRVAATAKLRSSGKYTMSRPSVKFATIFQTRFENYTTPCTGPSPAGAVPKGCREERIAAVTSNQIKVLKPKPKKHRK
jgi:hypothetical protein